MESMVFSFIRLETGSYVAFWSSLTHRTALGWKWLEKGNGSQQSYIQCLWGITSNFLPSFLMAAL